MIKEVVAFVYAPDCFCSRIAWFDVTVTNMADIAFLEQHAQHDVVLYLEGKPRMVKNYLKHTWQHHSPNCRTTVQTPWSDTANIYMGQAESEDERYHSVRGGFDHAQDYFDARSITTLVGEPGQVVNSFYVVD